MVRVKSSQKVFTAEEVTNLTGICPDHLIGLAQSKHLGLRTSLPDGPSAWRFTNSDLMILAVLQPRCQH